MTERLVYENIFDAITDDPKLAAHMKFDADMNLWRRELFDRMLEICLEFEKGNEK